MRQIVLTKNYRFRNNPEMLKLDSNIRKNVAMDFKASFTDEEVAKLPAFYGVDQESEAEQISAYIKQILDNSTHDKIAILCRARGNNSDIIECVLNSTGIDYFYGMFTDEDENYVSFHQKCQDVFIKKFSKTKNINKRSLDSFVQEVKLLYEDVLDKTTTSLISLLEALVVKVSTDYSDISSEDKFYLLLEVFENHQLRQSMEYITSRVVISTIHGAKGLEWDYVFLVDLERWVFPNFLCSNCSESRSYPTEGICCLPSILEDDFCKPLMEELSVYYVGITRACKQVYVSASKIRVNSDRLKKYSCFSCMASLEGVSLVDVIN